MTITEFFALPEAAPVVVSSPQFGLAPIKDEGEAYLEAWQTPDGRPWWTINSRTERQTYATRDH